MYLKLRNKYFYSNNNIHLIDSTFILNKFGYNKIKRNKYFKNKNCNKISMITDNLGVPLSIFIDSGNVHDLSFIEKHMNDMCILTNKNKNKTNFLLLADKTYESSKHREYVNNFNYQFMIPKKKNMVHNYYFDKDIYKKRNRLYNAKTMNYTDFIKYTQLKLKLRKLIIKEESYNKYVNKLKWFSYINRQKHENKLINKIKSIYGKEPTIVLGDWDKGSRLKYISTPNTYMKKLLERHFKIYLIDEYKTSKIYYKDITKENDNLCVKINGHKERLYSVLTFKMGKNMES